MEIEIVNCRLEAYLCCFPDEEPKSWSTWILLAELSYNTAFHNSIKMSQFAQSMGLISPNGMLQCHVSFVDDFEKMLMEHEQILNYLKNTPTSSSSIHPVFCISQSCWRIGQMEQSCLIEYFYKKREWPVQPQHLRPSVYPC